MTEELIASLQAMNNWARCLVSDIRTDTIEYADGLVVSPYSAEEIQKLEEDIKTADELIVKYFKNK